MVPEIAFDDIPYVPRSDLIESQRVAWGRLARPGEYLRAERKLAVAAEVRHAATCTFCVECKDALSPFAIDGNHDHLGTLSAGEVELIHRLVTDSGRLSKSWFDRCLASGLSEEEFVEISGIVCLVMVVDTFSAALGSALPDLPTPIAGKPSGRRATNAAMHDAWVTYVEPDDVVPEDGIVYEDGPQPPVIKALSLLPDIKRMYWEMVDVHYLPYDELWNFSCDLRALSRAQLEILAARTSAIHQCAY